MNLKAITTQVCLLAQDVAVFERNEFNTFSQEMAEAKLGQAHDLVSYVDVESEKKLIAGLSKILPQAGFITEETNYEYKTGLNWIVDPIDGTTNFVQGVPHFCISIALAQGSDILLGVVLDVMASNCYFSFKGGHSYCNDKQISVSKKLLFKDSFSGTGFSVKDNSRLSKNINLLEIVIKETRGVRRLGSAALDLCFVAKGVFDFYYESNLSAWDVAAGALIVKNAGGQVSDYKGGDQYLFGDEILASNTKLHANALVLLNKVN